MHDMGCLIIDDVTTAIAHMTEFGRRAATPAAMKVRNEVLRFAGKRGWTVVSYATFLEWAMHAMQHGPRKWIVLDPLFPTSRISGAVTCRFRRSATLGRFQHTAALPELENLEPDKTVGILDDAAASGSTLHHAWQLLSARGVSVTSVRLCASTRLARDVSRRWLRGVSWKDFLPGDWRIAHLRDGCAFLPYTGGCVSPETLNIEPSVVGSVCRPTSDVVGSLWQAMHLDREVRTAVLDARSSVPNRAEELLGRAVAVSDLHLLGEGCQVMVDGGATVTPETALRNLAPRSAAA